MKRVFRLFPPRRQAIKEKQIAECYTRSPEGQVIVRVHLSSPTALLMPFEDFPPNFGKESDDQPARVLNLSQDFVDYLFARIADLGDEALLLRINLSSPTATDEDTSDKTVRVIRKAIRAYFSYLEAVRRQDLQKLVWDAALLGLLGAGALSLSVLLEARSAQIEVGIGQLLLTQGVTVFGWLTLWEALANILWHWRPLYQQLRLSQRIQLAQLELAPAGLASQPAKQPATQSC